MVFHEIQKVGLVQGNRKYSLYSIQTITPMESPHKPQMQVCMYVCVCIIQQLNCNRVIVIVNIKISQINVTLLRIR